MFAGTERCSAANRCGKSDVLQITEELGNARCMNWLIEYYLLAQARPQTSVPGLGDLGRRVSVSRNKSWS